MKSIFMLAFAPIRKNKGQSISLLVFVLITAMILNIGLVLYFGISNIYDESAKTNHAAHFSSVYYSGSGSIQECQKFLENDLRVSEMEKTQAIGGFGKYGINDVNALTFLMFARANEVQNIDKLSLIGDYLPLTDNHIYVPNSVFLSGGYKLGDDFKVSLLGTELNLKVAGATEEVVFGSQMNISVRFYISDEIYNELESTFPGSSATLFSVRLDDKKDALLFQTDYDKAVSPDGLAYTLTYDSAKMSRVMIPTMIAMIITAFAIILLVVSLIVIRFRIINDIEENMTNIGVQKAMGYRNSQIVAANVMQYGLVALVGGVIGVALCGLVLLVITKIFEPMLALAWNPGFNLSTSVSSVLIVLITVVLIAFMTSQKIGKLHPLTALRGGATIHGFRQNAFSLRQIPWSIKSFTCAQANNSKQKTDDYCQYHRDGHNNGDCGRYRLELQHERWT